MPHTIDTLQTADGLNLHTESWLPDHNPKAIVIIAHGIGEHIGRYVHVADYLVAQGYAVYGIDHRTHGKSEGEPRVFIDDFAKPVADLKRYLDKIKVIHPGSPIFIYGHSMGSLIALLFTLAYQEHLAGFISSGSPLMLDTTYPAFVVAAGGFLNRIIPKMRLIPLGLGNISRDKSVISAYENDPLVHVGRIRVGMAVAGNTIMEPTRKQVEQLHLPLFVLHGSDDTTTPLSGSEWLYEKAQSTDKALNVYPGLYHEIHNEPEKHEVLADIVTWLDNHLNNRNHR